MSITAERLAAMRRMTDLNNATPIGDMANAIADLLDDRGEMARRLIAVTGSVQEAIAALKHACFQGGAFAERGIGSSDYVVETAENLRQALIDVCRLCTCHPDDNPPRPCARQYALQECRIVGALHQIGWTMESLELRDGLYHIIGVSPRTPYGKLQVHFGLSQELVLMHDSLPFVLRALLTGKFERELQEKNDERG